MSGEKSILKVNNFSFFYGNYKALTNIIMNIEEKTTTAFIGPSGCGKSTLLRCFNRMNDLIDNVRYDGDILLDNSSIMSKNVELTELRTRIGMVFQKSNPFPMSIYDNITYGPRKKGIKNKTELEEIAFNSLKQAALWNEVKDKLQNSAIGLSGGQQQRICIARAIAMKPEILLMDEPCSALDPISTSKIEELIKQLQNEYTIVIVTHNMQQAARVSDDTGFMLLGELVEFGKTSQIFTAPLKKRTEDYVTGRFG